jgi:hypothetical protein
MGKKKSAASSSRKVDDPIVDIQVVSGKKSKDALASIPDGYTILMDPGEFPA